MNKFKELRKSKHLTQKEFAKIINVAQPTISKWEKGKAIPDVQMLPILAKFFNVSVDYLLTDISNCDFEISKNNFAEFLKEQIGDKTLGEIENITGVSKSYLSKVLRGERATPKPKTLQRLSKALPCSYDELVKNAFLNNYDAFLNNHIENLGKANSLHENQIDFREQGNKITNLRNARKKANMSQDDVSKILGIPKTTYANYEQIEDCTPPLKIIYKLADLFDCSIDYLLGYKKEVGESSNTLLIVDKSGFVKQYKISDKEKRMFEAMLEAEDDATDLNR